MIEDVEQNVAEVDEVQTVQMETEKPVQNNQPEIEGSKRCFIILTDIRENALFDKYLKKTDEQMKPLESVADLSPIEIPDSDDEHIDDDNNNFDDCSSSEQDVVVLLSDSD